MYSALQILERSLKLRCRSLSSRGNRGRTCTQGRSGSVQWQRTYSTHSVKEIDEGLGLTSLETPGDVHVRSTAQERLNLCETFARGDFHRIKVCPEPRI